jgi:phenylalanyl-tRNA synthetase beta chain
MRSSIWPGLLSAASSNVARQQERVRMFEIGKTFHGTPDSPGEVVRVAGLAYGDAAPEQWGSVSQTVDFFDIKSDVSALLGMTGNAHEFAFVAGEHPALQAGQTAQIIRDGNAVGMIGKLHPTIARTFDLDKGAILFELAAQAVFATEVPVAAEISKFPMIRRDIAVVVADEVATSALVAAVQSVAPDLIRNVRIFDVYKGSGIEAGRKSVALGLILQETSRTLTDDDADAAMAAAVRKLQQEFAAVLRE